MSTGGNPISAAPAADTATAAAAPVGLRRAPAEPSLVALLGRAGLMRIALAALGMTWLFSDQFIRLYRKWSDNPDWSHGFLVPLFSLYFIHSKRAELARIPIRPSWAGLFVLLAAIGGYFYAIYAKFGSPQPLAIVVAIAGLVLLMGGWRLLRSLAFPIAFLLLALPPPERRYREITQPLQRVAAISAEHVLQLLPNVYIERSGVNITYDSVYGGHGSFAVAGACSGMRSLMAFVALGLAMAYFAPRPMWHRLFMAAIVIPVAVFCNIVRVIATGLFQIYDYGNLAKGTPHTVLGLGTFALGFAIYFAILFVLDRLYTDAPDEPELPEVAA